MKTDLEKTGCCVVFLSKNKETATLLKPFYFRELKHLLQKSCSKEQSFSFSGYTLNLRKKELLLPSQETELLTEKEIQLLSFLFKERREVSKEEILGKIWNYSINISTHTLETHIYKLRKKMQDEDGKVLKTEASGYLLCL
ncbi:MAG: winged helix-turn-helix domain-containing protein [Alphaproteobacteria bacterium]|nr:winged helix-turn-helix domain-containing protein [Alphaproteobacteria bacterium]